MVDSSIRQRPNKLVKNTAPQKTSSSKLEDTDRVISVLDIIRVLVTLVVAVLGVSYYTTSGESFIYGYKPWFLNPAKVMAWYEGEILLTPAQLLKYDGSNPDLPVYIAVNGTIFDVSAGRRMYQPGASYSVFAGRDASRAFVTGCFAEDRTHDMRDAEIAYLPIEDVPNEDIDPEEKKMRAELELEAAKQRAHAEIARWSQFYASNDKYHIVGRLRLPKVPSGPPPPLCDYAQKGRPKRSQIIAQLAAQAQEEAKAQADQDSDVREIL